MDSPPNNESLPPQQEPVVPKPEAGLRIFLKIYILGTLAACTLWLLNCTLRWKRMGLLADSAFWADNGARIIAFWHDTQLCMPFAYAAIRREKPHAPQIYTLMSAHSDGRIIAWATKLLGFGSVVGSSTRGGTEGLRNLILRANEGSHSAITPDGPRGPRHHAKKGIVVLARETGFPLCPVVACARSKWVFGSWDRMFLPKPFTTVVVHCGKPMTIARDLPDTELEAQCRELEARLEQTEKEAADAIAS